MNSNADSPVDAICPPDNSSTPVTSAAAECPMAQLLDTLSGKWTFSILHRLIMSDSPLRFGELQRSVSGITQKELTRHLREFEKLDLLTRKIYPEVPPRVEYRITDYGKTLQVPLAELARWSMTYGERLFAARRQLRRK
jgi:DNA-binding HxlR family transcriptional regulator